MRPKGHQSGGPETNRGRCMSSSRRHPVHESRPPYRSTGTIITSGNREVFTAVSPALNRDELKKYVYYSILIPAAMQFFKVITIQFFCLFT